MSAPTKGRPAVRFDEPGEDGVGRILIDRPDDAVNALDEAVVEGLAASIRQARAYSALRGLVIASAKVDQFVAGADLKMLTQATHREQLERASQRFQAVNDELAWLPCTTVAAINGPALGGGLELALACDYRVAAETEHVSLGQPEVNLGLLPAGGGTQRLPRLVGLQRGIELITSGRRLNARRARRMGVLDEVVHPTVLDQAARAWARKPKRPLDRPLHLDLSDVAEQTRAGRRFIYAQARKAILERTRGHYPAPLAALEAIETGLERGLAAGLEVEARAFAELGMSETARNLIWLFIATQRQRHLMDASAREVERVGVVGAGFMGAGIAEVAAAAGLPVRVRDVAPEAVARGVASVRRLVDDGVRRRRFSPREAREILNRVSGTSDYSGFTGVEVAIEAVFEELEVKQRVLADLEAALPADAVIASNTSALPIAHVAARARHPERIVGMHFFSPAHRMPLVEVVRPTAAAEWAVATTAKLAARMGKTPIVVGDGPAFYTSRVLGLMMNEAALLLEEGAGMAAVDSALVGFGFPVGPFVLYDEVGLEVALHAGETVISAFGDRVVASALVPALVAAGQRGRRSGAGFYMWPKPRKFLAPKRVPNPAVARLLNTREARAWTAQAIQERLVLLLVNEAIRCLDEGVLSSATDGELGAVLGLGFPPFLGGPFHYADALTPPELERRLRALAAEHGIRYTPAELLVRTAAAGGAFFPREP